MTRLKIHIHIQDEIAWKCWLVWQTQFWVIIQVRVITVKSRQGYFDYHAGEKVTGYKADKLITLVEKPTVAMLRNRQVHSKTPTANNTSNSNNLADFRTDGVTRQRVPDLK